MARDTSRREIYIDALREAVHMLYGQMNYVEILKEPIRDIYSRNVSKANATSPVDESIKLLNATGKCIHSKINDLMRKTTKEISLGESTREAQLSESGVQLTIIL